MLDVLVEFNKCYYTVHVNKGDVSAKGLHSGREITGILLDQLQERAKQMVLRWNDGAQYIGEFSQ